LFWYRRRLAGELCAFTQRKTAGKMPAPLEAHANEIEILVSFPEKRIVERNAD